MLFIRRLVSGRRIRYVKLGKHVRIGESVLSAYAEERTGTPSVADVPALRRWRDGAAREKVPRRSFGATRKLYSGRYQARCPGTGGVSSASLRKRTGPSATPRRSSPRSRPTGPRPDRRRGAVLRVRHALDRRALRRRYRRGAALATASPPPGAGLRRAARQRHQPGRGEDVARGTRKATGATTAAKSCLLLKAIMQTAVEDELIRWNPRGAGRGGADERPVATVEEVFAFPGVIGIRWRLMVLLGAFASMRQRSSPSRHRPRHRLGTGAAGRSGTEHRPPGDR